MLYARGYLLRLTADCCFLLGFACLSVVTLHLSSTLHAYPLEPSIVHALTYHQVEDTRPPSARANLTNVADVPKYVMPAETYSTLPDSVLAWKKANKLGRFDPHAPEIEKKKIDDGWMEVEGRGMMLLTLGQGPWRFRVTRDDY